MKSHSKIWIWLPLPAATVVGLSAPNSLAHALELTGNATLSPRSGHAGTASYTLGDPDNDTAASYGIDVRERSNDPCLVTLGIEDLDNASSDSAPDLDFCGPIGSGNGYGTVFRAHDRIHAKPDRDRSLVSRGRSLRVRILKRCPPNRLQLRRGQGRVVGPAALARRTASSQRRWVASTIGVRIVPRRSISTSTVSPGWSSRGGLRA